MKRILKLTPLTLLICLCLSAKADASLFYVWTDSTLDGMKDTLLGSINSYDGNISGKNNYDYYSFSAHPVNGPSPHENRLKIFVYEKLSNERNFLNIMAGEDEKGPNRWRTFSLDIDIFGSSLDPKKVQGDEPRELQETAEDHFEGDWRFKKNTDGGVIGGLKGDWEAKITFNDTEMNRHLFASSGSDNIRIDDYLDKGYDTYFISRTDQLSDSNVVPEPATMLLFGGGLAGMFLKRRKK